MICTNCGNQIDDNSRFCTFCGSALIPAPTQQSVQQAPQAPQQPIQQVPDQSFQQPVQPTQPSPAPQQSFKPQPGPAPQQSFQPQPGPQTPAQNLQQPSKSKTPLIIGIVCGAVALLAIIGIVLVLFLRKGDDDTIAENTTEAVTEDTEDTEATTEDATEAMTKDDNTEETTEATTEETTEAPETPAYAEENGCELVDPASATFTGNCVGVFHDENDNINEYDKIEATGTYNESLGRIYRTQPDTEGNVLYYVEILCNSDASITDKDLTVNWTFNTGFWIPDIVDYYTGDICFLPDSASGLIDDEEKKTSNVNGIDITTVCLFDEDSDKYSWTNKGIPGGTAYSYSSSNRHIYIIKAPYDYDGLMLAFYEGDVDYDQYVKYNEMESSFETYKIFDVDPTGNQYTADDITFVRLSDYASEDPYELSQILSTGFRGADPDSFDWTENYGNDSSLNEFPITESAYIEGTWNAYLIWDEDNANNSYQEQAATAFVTVDDAAEGLVELEMQFNKFRYSSSGDWKDDTDENVTYYGKEYEDDSYDFSNEETSFKIDSFYSDGYVEYAVGTMTHPDGISAKVFLYRP